MNSSRTGRAVQSKQRHSNLLLTWDPARAGSTAPVHPRPPGYTPEIRAACQHWAQTHINLFTSLTRSHTQTRTWPGLPPTLPFSGFLREATPQTHLSSPWRRWSLGEISNGTKYTCHEKHCFYPPGSFGVRWAMIYKSNRYKSDKSVHILSIECWYIWIKAMLQTSVFFLCLSWHLLDVIIHCTNTSEKKDQRKKKKTILWIDVSCLLGSIPT